MGTGIYTDSIERRASQSGSSMLAGRSDPAADHRKQHRQNILDSDRTQKQSTPNPLCAPHLSPMTSATSARRIRRMSATCICQ